MEERDLLIRQVFPELRRRCRERQVELVDVDLRWGITEEQSRSGETLPICLQEIDRCRPSVAVFFIGLIGERYGWIPKECDYARTTLEDPKLAWIKEHIGGKSMTELEILHGVLRNRKMRDRAFFYFRKDGYARRCWPQIQKYHRGIKPPVTPGDFDNSLHEGMTSARAKAAQQNLKQRIRDASLRWDPRQYDHPSSMAQMALEDIWSAIDAAFPANSVPDELEQQRLEHTAFAHSRTASYLPRPNLHGALDSLLKKDGPETLVVTGSAGSGKSALLAAWLEMAAHRLPKRTFVHFIGATPDSASANRVVHRLHKTLQSWGATNPRAPASPEESVKDLPELLKKAAARGPVLLVLDALDQLEDERDKDLWWLPRHLPKGVKLVASTLPGTSAKSLMERNWMRHEVEVTPLEESERKEVIALYLKNASRCLDRSSLDRICNAPQTSNPLFLRVLLDELRTRASHSNLGGKLEEYLEAADSTELFAKVLSNLEEYDRERPRLVRESMGYLALARRGLTEPELLELLSSSKEPAREPLPRHCWSPLFLALHESLVNRGGRLSFFHDHLRRAVERRYLSAPAVSRKLHRRLGELAKSWDTNRFGRPLVEYGLEHGAFHLAAACDRSGLIGLLNNKEFRLSQKKTSGHSGWTLSGLRIGLSILSSFDHRDGSIDARFFKLIPVYHAELLDAHRSMQAEMTNDGDTNLEHALIGLESLDPGKALDHAMVLCLRIACGRDTLAQKKLALSKVSRWLATHQIQVADVAIELEPLANTDDTATHRSIKVEKAGVEKSDSEEQQEWLQWVSESQAGRFDPDKAPSTTWVLGCLSHLLDWGEWRGCLRMRGISESECKNWKSFHEKNLLRVHNIWDPPPLGLDPETGRYDEAKLREMIDAETNPKFKAEYIYPLFLADIGRATEEGLSKAIDWINEMGSNQWRGWAAVILAESIAGLSNRSSILDKVMATLPRPIARIIFNWTAERLAINRNLPAAHQVLLGMLRPNLTVADKDMSAARLVAGIAPDNSMADVSPSALKATGNDHTECLTLMVGSTRASLAGNAATARQLIDQAKDRIRAYGSPSQLGERARLLVLLGKAIELAGDEQEAWDCFTAAFEVFEPTSAIGNTHTEAFLGITQMMSEWSLTELDLRALARLYQLAAQGPSFKSGCDIGRGVLEALCRTGHTDRAWSLIRATQGAIYPEGAEVQWMLRNKTQKWLDEQREWMRTQKPFQPNSEEPRDPRARFLEQADLKELSPLGQTEAIANLLVACGAHPSSPNGNPQGVIIAIQDTVAAWFGSGHARQGRKIARLCNELGLCRLIADH
jgi:nephrocystin-3